MPMASADSLRCVVGFTAGVRGATLDFNHALKQKNKKSLILSPLHRPPALSIRSPPSCSERDCRLRAFSHFILRTRRPWQWYRGGLRVESTTQAPKPLPPVRRGVRPRCPEGVSSRGPHLLQCPSRGPAQPLPQHRHVDPASAAKPHAFPQPAGPHRRIPSLHAAFRNQSPSSPWLKSTRPRRPCRAPPWRTPTRPCTRASTAAPWRRPSSRRPPRPCARTLSGPTRWARRGTSGPSGKTGRRP